MKIRNPFANLTKFEWLLWGGGIFIISASFFLIGEFHLLTLIASLTGITSLIFVARGDVTGQFLMIAFSILYGVISYQFRYYGEMATYLGMTMPIAMLSAYTWLKHPYEDSAEVEVSRLGRKQLAGTALLTMAVTILFYFILKALGTSNLVMSTVSVATSFFAASMQALRSPLYALSYAANDMVLIVLWTMASMTSISYLPMVICFVIFLLNDIYGYISWQRMQLRQAKAV